MDAEKMTITLDTEDMRTVLASVGFVVCDWKEKARDEKSGKMAHESAVRNAQLSVYVIVLHPPAEYVHTGLPVARQAFCFSGIKHSFKR